MASAHQFAASNGHDLPVVLLHRIPRFNITAASFAPMVKTPVRWLDPVVDRPELVSSLRESVRVLLCVINTPVNSEVLDQYPALECVVCMATGLDHVDLVACRRRGIKVTNAGDAFSDDVADYAVGLAIDVMRRVSAGDRFVRAGFWGYSGGVPSGTKVSGKRVGIVGLGNIGMRVARRMEGFDCSIAYNSKRKKANVSYPYYENVRDLASSSDILIIACALVPETHHVINKDVLRALGRRGVVVNIGRGGLVDEKELVKFLVRGEIGGAGLDVFEDEPNVPKELFELDNVVLSPHKSAITPEGMDRQGAIIVGNIDAFFSNKPLLSEVELE